MQDPTRGITNSAYRDVIRGALRNGWEFVKMTKTTHGQIIWPPTGEIVSFATTPSATAFKHKAAQIRSISGVETWKPPQRGRSRKKDQTSGFSLDHARSEHRVWDDKWGARVAALHEEHNQLIQEFAELREQDENRTVIDQARKILRRVLEVEKGLENMHQPYETFDPFNINEEGR